MLKRTNRIISVVHTDKLGDLVAGFYSVETNVYFRNAEVHLGNLILISYGK
ncbi:hypothetical protein Ami103574_00110 [Aminipila butyrica]|uniref:Uncharacterized protein n=1 Tax=Aminipila butyrica TaxID=433296 RepID=A0A858BQL5_9FIRM|nr:hypothetical protein [Aminipila butyrica]QIB67817.1 hypothetical protein Ami103574_00110 [Aminipila butyrica]